ncbi:MAG: ABC transporter ATP-binding protein [Sphingobacteriales bacterium JAD_PAG50586_3]|nr:MAG: ABC transporter ATP-binding protein [Sphingobacteriales bacterium JAD_PAG50586_3]
MSDVAIRVENVSKFYRLGYVGASSINDDLQRFWQMNILRKPDPFLSLAQTNARDTKGSDYVWALRDVNFDVQKGEVLGIIGKNGAGKSTLLKILAKVTGPTTGAIKINGRIASLLEVGTGFHPELTGRENIFLNGAVLGMRKAEIKAKFDEIVDFSGVERYIDTPVKRYSSGMYVRLAFAVAAHLEPDILIIDEVLAVGDAEFQRKCIGKIQNVSRNEGRTVLFVSHNMTSIADLCTQCVFMKQGQVLSYDTTSKIIGQYLQDNLNNLNQYNNLESVPRDNNQYAKRVKIISMEMEQDNYFWKDQPEFHFTVKVTDPNITELEFGFAVNGANGSRVFTYESEQAYACHNEQILSFRLKITDPVLVPSRYYISLGIRSHVNTLDAIDNYLSFSVLDTDKNGKHFGFTQGPEISGYVDSAVDVSEIHTK